MTTKSSYKNIVNSFMKKAAPVLPFMERMEAYFSPGVYGYICSESSLKKIIGLQFYNEVKQMLLDEHVIIRLAYDEENIYLINSHEEAMRA